MKKWPKFSDNGDLPPGIHQSTLSDVIEYFGKGGFQRAIVSARLQRIYSLAIETGHVSRFIIFGSFVTNKSDPQDIDIFLLMDDNLMSGGSLERQAFSSITWLPKTTRVQVYFGLDEWRRFMGKKQPLSTGKSSAMVINEG